MGEKEGSALRVLFYLPVVTEWWFDKIIGRLIRCAAREAEVHVIACPLWRLTGIGERQLAAFLDMPEIRWHIIGGEEHQSLRTVPLDPDALVAFVREIDPDYTFCRSADMATPSRFPGKVRFVMEGSMPPFPQPSWIYLQSAGLYDHGLLPPLDAGQRAYLDGRMAPGWDRLHARYPDNEAARQAYLASAGLPADRKIIALPVDYEGVENFFYPLHRVTPPNAAFIAELAARIDDEMVLALTRHPIEHAMPYRDIQRVVAAAPDRVRFVDTPDASGDATLALIRHGDGLIVRDSKAFAAGAFFGAPMLRLSRFVTGDWMKAYADLPAFLDAVRSGTARAASAADARTWFGFHHANNVFDAADPGLTLETLIDRVERPFDPSRWEASLDRCRFDQPLNFA